MPYYSHHTMGVTEESDVFDGVKDTSILVHFCVKCIYKSGTDHSDNMPQVSYYITHPCMA